ncbi:MAG: hypothetical protein ACXACX_15420 [Candidatus Hodarchaeales archaeon]|jgi:hypothetical protein
MEKIAFVSYLESDNFDYNIALLSSSLRKFGGSLAESPLIVFHSQGEKSLHYNLKPFLSALDVELVPLEIPKTSSVFPFLNFVLAAAMAETLYKEKYENLVWLDSNTLILSEPKEFFLFSNKLIGFRPVHHTLIGSIFEKPLDSFWGLLFKKFMINEEKLFPMKTHVDENTLRPYFNSGCLVVRPQNGLLNNWWEKFSSLYLDPDFKKYFEQDWKYRVFMHQAILSCVILSSTNQDDLYQLPFTYNYPLHLYAESNEEFRPGSIEDLVTARFENINEPKWLESIPLHEPVKKWLNSQFDIYSKIK